MKYIKVKVRETKYGPIVTYWERSPGLYERRLKEIEAKLPESVRQFLRFSRRHPFHDEWVKWYNLSEDRTFVFQISGWWEVYFHGVRRVKIPKPFE